MLEWSVPPDRSVDDIREVRKANPAPWLTDTALQQQRKRLQDLDFRRFIANQWTERRGYWLPPGAFERCVGSPELVVGEKIWCGVDIGGERSSSAVAWVTERLHAGVAVFHGERGVLECLDKIRELAATYEVAEVVADPVMFGQGMLELEGEGMTVVKYSQGDTRMIEASQVLHAAIVERRIVFPDSPVLARHVADTVALHSRRGWRIGKPAKETNIDAVVALALAVVRASEPPRRDPRILGEF